MRNRSWVVLGVTGCAAVLAIVACGTDGNSTFTNPSGDDGGGNNSSGGFGGDGSSGDRAIDSLTIDPPTATLDLVSAPFPTQTFHATAHFADGSTAPANPQWSASNRAVGSIDGSGVYTPRGAQGGTVTITASAGGKSATAILTVKLHQVDNPAGLDPTTQGALLGATTADTAITWTYPYDGMAYARGLNAPEMMWNGNAAGDVYAIHIESATYELQSFKAATPVTATAGTTPPGAAAYDFSAALWEAFANSTSGDATVTVTRKHGSAFTKVITQTWKLASRSMSGTIYYWAINKGAVVRIKPGAAAPDPFLASATVPPPGEKNFKTNQTTTQMICPSCHTVSADGSTLAMGTGWWGNGSDLDVWSSVYDLKAGKTVFHDYQSSDPPTRYPLAALTPDGKVLVENWANVRGHGMGKDDVPIDLTPPLTVDKTIPGTALDTLVGSGHHTFFPVFSADNALFAYVDSSTGELFTLDWNPTTKKFSNKVKVALAPASGKIAYPTISPDHRWIVYQVGPDFGSLDTSYLGDLYAVDLKNPLHPIALDQINKSMSAAATTTRDQHRSYEATFAPVASGGYFWIVFHSRRTYGNRLVDIPYSNGHEGSGTKQLWVAAIDVAGEASHTGDPSHPPFWLPGQDPTTRNMRGYWALDPCHAEGASCSTGTDCCGGFCDATNDAGAPVCGKSSVGCSDVGDKCDLTSECCGAATGVTCINHACSEPAPK